MMEAKIASTVKVLYTFDNENKTNCLARWPHVLDIQTAYLDEQTPVGVIELKTCIQAIVSASPELVAQLGKDYTVYAYDYSEYETPLVGQGMLSWVLASSSPTPDAPAHQSKTMVTGRVCKNPMGLFSKGAAHETLEVKLRLVPVPTVMQSEYLDSMQKYRELSNVIPHEFDAQSWTSFVRQNPGLLETAKGQQFERTLASMSHSGIDRFHQLLSEGSTPRDFSNFPPPNESVRSTSPAQSYAPSRISTPGGSRPSNQHQSQKQGMPSSDIIRPSSSASMRDNDFQMQTYDLRRNSVQSGYGSGGEDSVDPQPRKRAKVYQATWPGKSDMNIERQPSSLRVAASTAASVRIHRPTPVNPSLVAAVQQSTDEPVRPPTPISRPADMPRRGRLPSSLLRESSITSTYTSPYCMSDDQPAADQAAHSPEESRYQGLFEPSFTMPSSPPIMDGRFPQRSSPVLPPLSLDTDSGFMSGGLEDLLDDDAATPLDDCRRADSHDIGHGKRPVRSAVQASSPASAIGGAANDLYLVSDGPKEQNRKDAQPSLPRPSTSGGSRPSSRASVRMAPKPLAPAPMSQSAVEQLMNAIPASDPVGPTHPPLQHSQTWAGPMSDFTVAETPAPPPEDGKVRSGAGAKRMKQVQARLDQAIRSGQVPPYCENCGSIETPTWRRAWSKEIVGDEDTAREMLKDSTMLFWQVLERDDNNDVSKFKVYKKSLVDADNDWAQILLCNPCGLWLHKFKTMRPENKWNKVPAGKRKRPSRSRRDGPLSQPCPATRTRSKAPSSRVGVSSPAPTEASSVPDGPTPGVDNDNDQDYDVDASPNKRRRANSVEPRRSTDTSENRWHGQDAMEALRRAIQSSPARNMEAKHVHLQTDNDDNLTPKPVRRMLFNSAHNEGPLKPLDASSINSINSCSPRRSPRIASRGEKRIDGKENMAPTPRDDLDGLFESPTLDFDLPTSPTPRRRNHRPSAFSDKFASVPCNSPTINKRRDGGLGLSPARLTAERLQRAQEHQGSPRSKSRQNRSPSKHSRAHTPGIPSLADDGLHSEAFESIDGMIMDIFDTEGSFPLGNTKFGGENWADWLPEDYVSPVGSNDDAAHPSDDLFNVILSDPAVDKEHMHDSEFNPFNFGDASVPDSGFFSSDALHQDPTTKSSAEEQQQHGSLHAASPAS
ncbi:hypothetical protein N7474_000871 [Penicillium riverlandense]|uniref:uncharacterized protein n=1 Tax=Penicillium riverlandense TaxID=1903569 RepID=UPI0025493F6F|nr:uncharacterized protein N7474_000871 [Penicillium riverlandense]KAJ5832560.1 hypothetical protein N7474_000871 [Penicillium riverlandense]